MTTTAPGVFTLDELLAEQGLMGRLARALVGEGAEDLVHDAWLAALAHPPTSRQPAAPWLATVVRNLARNRTLAARRRTEREAAVALSREPEHGAEQLLAKLELQRLVAGLVADLPEPLRQTLLLRYFEGRSAADIARLLEIPAGTVRWRLKRALDELRARLDQRHGGRRQLWCQALLPFLHLPAPASASRPPHPQRCVPFGRAVAGITAVTAMFAVVAAFMVWGRWPRPHTNAGHASAASAKAPRIATRAGREVARPIPRLNAEANREAGFILEGRVVDPEGQPVADATVTGHRQSAEMVGEAALRRELPPTMSEHGGGFRFTGLKPGYYNLFASARGFAVGSRVSIDVGKGGTREWAELQLWRGGAVLSGRVFDAGAGPIPGARVEIRGSGPLSGRPFGISPAPQGFTLATDAEGHFEIRLAQLGYTVRVSADGYATTHSFVALSSDRQHDLRLEPSRPLTGRVVSATSGGHEPVAGAEVLVISEEGRVPNTERALVESTFSDEGGQFAFVGLPPGAHRVVARTADLLGELAHPVVVGDQPLASVEIELGIGAQVRGTVTSDGKPVSGARVDLATSVSVASRFPRGLPIARSGDDGSFVLGAVLPGDYWLRARDENGRLRFDEPLTVRTSLRIDVELGAPTQVTGVVFTSAGRPAVGARVEGTVRRAEGPQLGVGDWALTDDHGRFSLPRLGDGRLSLLAHGGGEAVHLPAEPLRRGDTKHFTLSLAPGAHLSGTATWDDGTPAADLPLALEPPRINLGSPGPRTDERGRFALDGLPAGPTTITALPGSHSLAAAESARATRTLTPGARESGIALVVPSQGPHLRPRARPHRPPPRRRPRDRLRTRKINLGRPPLERPPRRLPATEVWLVIDPARGAAR